MTSLTLTLGKYSLLIISSVAENLCCFLCSKVMDNPHQAPCGCRFCFDCIDNYLKFKEKYCPGGSEDCFEIKLNIQKDLRTDVLAKREISKVIVKCPLYLCDDECELRKIKDHLTECATTVILCVKCNGSVTREEYENHEGNECEESIVTCEFCNLLLLRRDLQRKHWNFEHNHLCSQYVDYCPNECGERDKVKWAEHRIHCQRKYVECPYGSIGCIHDKISLKDVPKHLRNKESSHTELLLKHVNNLRIENENLRDNLENITNEFNVLKQKDKSQEKEIEKLNNCLNIINHTLEKVKKDNIEKTKEMKKVLMKENENSQKLKKELESINIKIYLMKKEFEQVITEGKKKGIEIKEMSDLGNKNLVPTNPRLEWKVEDFSMINNIFSPSFYTHHNGYKMDLRLFKITKGYLSLYVRIKCGEYDDTLSWPCRKCLKVQVIDQDKLDRHYEKVIIMDDKVAKFCNRQYFSNTGDIQVLEFISYEELYKKTYLLKNNNLFIHCFVEDHGHTKL